jgi:hypothetical protein
LIAWYAKVEKARLSKKERSQLFRSAPNMDGRILKHREENRVGK